MKRDVMQFVAKCLNCQQVKIEHQKLSGLLQPLLILVWKWEDDTMDFVTGLLRSRRGIDAIWVIVDRLMKSTHFLPFKTTTDVTFMARLYIQEIMRLHGVPRRIILDRDPKYTSRIWKQIEEDLGMKLLFSIAYHPQTKGQSKRTIQTLEDLLRSCVLDWVQSGRDTFL